ncbi:hypothetical protein O7622_01250 [Micromonospora sp. WMMD1076]|uniref:hypothetical protein n=1 Tax=Micromonospora sp. WMMD1076 TaxID=3016103 RepID=UPI00249B4FF1|nr:hypothetical protein [Micromonospora sp. WMMD1076]WFF07257.1 hypothetical protein O7622_01250 [Micromonospora sp. WMMD1076]
MFLVYRPEGGEEQRWEYRPGRLRVMEMEAIEQHTGLAYATDFKAQLLKGQTSARRALLWTMLRRQHPTLKYADVDFYDDELLLERTKSEIEAEIAEVERLPDGDLSPEDRMLTLAVLRQQLADAPDDPGKALSPSDATPTP